MRQAIHQIVIATRGRGFYEFTSEVTKRLRDDDIATGLATLFVQHTSASLLIQENADPEVRRDFERFFARLVPDGDRLFRHTVEGEDDMPAHIRAALTATHLGIPIARGKLALGTWQGIYLWEHRASAHQRHVALHFLGD
jgi:secondary thiamine-phosphate synthase enzyme